MALVIDDRPPDPSKRLILVKEALERTSLPRSTMYEMIAAGMFPQPVHLTPRLTAFVEAEVDAWITDLISTRGGRRAYNARRRRGRRGAAA